MSEYLSLKLRYLSCLAILMVIIRHMAFPGIQKMTILDSIQGLNVYVCSICLPVFYLTSGYLYFFRKIGSVHDIFLKIQKRCRTLLIPYILTNLLVFLLYYVFSISGMTDNPITNSIHNGFSVSLLKTIFWDPIAFQLWFVRDLIIVIFFTPLIWLIFYKIIRPKFTMAFILLLLGADMIFNIGTALLWFSIGGIIAFNKINIEPRISLFWGWGCLLIWLTICLIEEFWHSAPWLWLTAILAGIASLWILFTPKVVKKIHDKVFLQRLASTTFFIFLAHEPLLGFLKKIPLSISHSQWWLITVYFVMPFLLIFILVKAGLLMKRLLPRTYSLFTGAR